jgi:uncharacterized damage-inducible protein DinB
MAKKMTVKTFINNVKQARAALGDAIAPLESETLTKPGVTGKWSIKDILAHITWFDRELVGILEAKSFISSGLWKLPPDERNAAIYKNAKKQSLEKVQAEAERVYKALLLGLGDIRDKDLHDPASFPGMPEDWIPWEVMAANTYEHYQEHLADIRKWLET